VTEKLTVTDHNRDIQGFKYVYPVVSRRAGGVSVGINLNTNNACNWRCIYCQVPDLKRGLPPPVDFDLLTYELRSMLKQIVQGDFMQTHVTEVYRHLEDIAFSGNGEPTSAKEFPKAISIVESILKEFNLLNNIKVRVITNGSMIHKPAVLNGIKHLSQINGEVWFKLDGGTQEDILKINDVNINPDTHITHLALCAKNCPTWIQTCMFSYKGQVPTEAHLLAYLAQVEKVKDDVQGVHLYGVARPSYQPEAIHIQQLPIHWLEALADRIRNLGLTVTVNP
jgi:wyosine [tRNA(Phe)-imidazoG37] synthetase (radical SAM superfamily)